LREGRVVGSNAGFQSAASASPFFYDGAERANDPGLAHALFQDSGCGGKKKRLRKGALSVVTGSMSPLRGRWWSYLGRVDVTTAALFLLAIIPPLAAAAVVLTHWVPLPFLDEWSISGETFTRWCTGTLSFRDLFAQVYESRYFFPRLLYLVLVQAGGWDVRKEMALILLSVGATVLLFHHAMRVSLNAGTHATLLVSAAASFLAFAPTQLDNFLWGNVLGHFFAGLALLAMIIVNLSERPLALKAFLNGMLALVATYTFANGMLLWPLGFPLASRGESRRWRCVIWVLYLLCAAAAVGVYFIGYRRPYQVPPLFGGGFELGPVAEFLVLWTGSYFTSNLVLAFVAGLVGIALFLAAAVGAVLVTGRSGAWRPFYPAAVLGTFALATASITAAGRIGIGVDQAALQTRYRAFSLSFYLALLALLFALYCAWCSHTAAQRRWLFQVGVSVAAAAALITWGARYPKQLRHVQLAHRDNVSLLRSLEWIEVIPNNPDLALIFPDPEVVRVRARALRECNLLRLPFVSAAFTEQLHSLPSPEPNSPAGQITTCLFHPNHNLYIGGLAQLPGHRKPDCVLVGASVGGAPFQPVSVIETSYEAGKKQGLANFDRELIPANLPLGDVTIAAWAVDLAQGKLYPLGGATLIRHAG